MMHDPDQTAALAERAARVAPGGVLVLQYHSLDTIVRLGQWNALRHGHFAYYSTSALVGMLETIGFSSQGAWRFDLYGGTVLLAATREPGPRWRSRESVTALLSDDACLGVRDPGVVGACRVMPKPTPSACGTGWSSSETRERACWAMAPHRGRSRSCVVPGWIDGSSLRLSTPHRPNTGLRMPGTDIPIVDPAMLATYPPDAVLLFVPDLLTEVRRAFPEVEASGAEWVDAEALHA